MLTTDSINPLVKDFLFLIDSINHRSQNPCQTDDHRSISSHSTDGIDPSVKIGSPIPIFLNKGEPSKYSSTIGCTKYDDFKCTVSKDLLQRTVKMNNAEVYSSIKSCIEYDD